MALDSAPPFDSSSDVAALFRDPSMFDNADSWQRAGFTIVRQHEERVLVASHELAQGYLFKKYSNARPAEEQLARYKRRVKGARMLREYVAAKQLRHIVVPQKWIYRLFDPPSYLLVVERADVVSRDETERKYQHIEEGVLRELCTILGSFKGLDVFARNCPFTVDGKIAFIDTEYVRRQRRPKRSRYFRYIRSILTDEPLHFAAELWRTCGKENSL